MIAFSRKSISLLVIAAGISLASGAAMSADSYRLSPLQAQVINLEHHTAVAYYTVLPDGNYEVITTIAPHTGIPGVASRQRVNITVGQTYSLELDQGAGNSSITAVSIAALPESVRLTYQ